MVFIKILNDFSEFPALRHCNISANSGEQFYHEVLNTKFAEAFSKKEMLSVVLDETAGYASSFLDEAFGNLVFDFTLEVVAKNVEIISIQEPHWKKMIIEQTYPQWESRRKSKQIPVVTETHKPWFRLINGQLQQNVWQSPATV